MIAKWSNAPARFPRLAALARLKVWLHGQGLQVDAPVATLDGRHQVEVDGAAMTLQRQVHGDLPDTTDEGEVRAAGSVLASLHAALARYPDVGRIPGLAVCTTTVATEVTSWLDAETRSPAGNRPRRPAATGVRRTRRALAHAARTRRLPVRERLVPGVAGGRCHRLRRGQS
jgi:homoserine kinase type II